MIDYRLDAARSVLHVHVLSALEAGDFVALDKSVDAHLDGAGRLNGIVIEAPSFPGWDSLGAMAAHIRFVRDHHKLLRRVAVVTGSPMGNVAERLASHFVAAEIKRFDAGQGAAAADWVAAA